MAVDFSSICANYLLSALKPDSVMLVSDWADENRVLSQTASAEPGKFRTARTHTADLLQKAFTAFFFCYSGPNSPSPFGKHIGCI